MSLDARFTINTRTRVYPPPIHSSITMDGYHHCTDCELPLTSCKICKGNHAKEDLVIVRTIDKGNLQDRVVVLMNNYPKCISEVPIREIAPLTHSFKTGPQDHMECDGFTTTERELLDHCRTISNTDYSKWTGSRWAPPGQNIKESPLPLDACHDITFKIKTTIPHKMVYANIPLESTPITPPPAFPRSKKVTLALREGPYMDAYDSSEEYPIDIKEEILEEDIRIQPTAETYPHLMNNLQKLRNLRPF